MGGTLSLRTHGSLHSYEVDELSGEGKFLLFADNWQHRDSGPKASGKQCSAPKGQLLTLVAIAPGRGTTWEPS